MPIKIDPAWFPIPQAAAPPIEAEWTPPWVAAQVPPPPSEPEWVPPWEQAFAAPPEPHREPDDPGYYVAEDCPYEYDPAAFAEDYPYWDEEPTEPEDDDIYVRPGEKVPFDAGELLRTYYVPGEGDVRVFARIHPDDMDLDPDQIIERPSLRRSFNVHFVPKGPKEPK